MAISVDRRIRVSIELAISTIVGRGFGTPLIMAYFDPGAIWPQRAKAYQSSTILTDLVADGFNTWHPVYKMAQALISQSIKPQEIVVGRKANAVVQAVDLTITTDNVNETISVTLSYGGQTEDYPQTGSGGGIPAEATAMAAAINAGIFGSAGLNYVSATAVGNDVQIRQGGTPVTGQIFYFSDLEFVEIEDVSADPGVAADLAAIRAANDSWYWLTNDVSSATETDALADEIETMYRIFAAQTQDTTVAQGTAGNICLVLQAKSYNRTFVNYSPFSMDEYPACRVVARAAPRPPGSYALAWKTYPGWTANVNNDELSNIEGSGGNALASLTEYQGEAVYSGGKTPDGLWVDFFHTMDALRGRIWTEIISILQAEDKIVYNLAAGTVVYNGEQVPGSVGGEVAVEAIERAVSGINQAAGGKAFDLDSLYTNYIPHQYQDPGDINQRIFNGVVFGLVILTAMENLGIDGTLRLVQATQ